MKDIKSIINNSPIIKESIKNTQKILDTLKENIDMGIKTEDFYFDKNTLRINLLPPQKTIFKPKKQIILNELSKSIKIKNIKVINW